MSKPIQPASMTSPPEGGGSELRKLAALALPAAGTQLSVMMLGVVDTAMVGRVGVSAMAALALANVWVYGVLMFGHGILAGVDPIIAQAHGARDHERAGRTLQHAIVWAVLLSAPAALALALTDRVLIALGQQPDLAHEAWRYTVMQIPGVPFFLLYTALRQYLQARELVQPALWVILIANAVHALGNWLLIFGHWGLPELGLVGAGIATSLTRIFCWVGLAALVWGLDLHQPAWVPWSRAAFELRRLREVLRYGWPTALQISLEIWAFSAAALVAGRIGAVAVAAHAASIQLAALAFMMPLGISLAACTRVGNLIGAGAHARAQRSAWVALALGAAVMSGSALCFLLLRGWLPTLFTLDPRVIELACSILPIAAAFQIFDGMQVVGCGVLRGMGRVRPVLVFNLVSYWALGLPLGAWLSLGRGWGLAGVWWGLCFGLAVAAALLVLWIRRHGPASAQPGAAL